MYGLVNRAICDLLQKELGEVACERVKQRAGVGVEVFVSLQTYPDQTTVSLVVAAAEEMKLPVETLLERFGEHWVDYAVNHGYRDLMQARGASLFDFIARLDDLHSRLTLTFPELRPPSFRVIERSQNAIRFLYISEREGLAPFVAGIIRGLGKLFNQPVDIVHTGVRGRERDNDEFVVTIA